MGLKLFTTVLIVFVSIVSQATAEKLSKPQIAELTTEVIKYVSNDFHVSEPPKWVWLNLPTKTFPELSENIRMELAKKYTVVSKESDLPVNSRYAGVTYTSWDGFMLSIEARQIRQDEVRITYSFYGGRFAPSRQIIQYEWAKSKWKIVSDGGTIIY